MDKRRLVLIGTHSVGLQRTLKNYFADSISGSVVYIANDGTDLLNKASRTKPNLVIFTADLPRTSETVVYRHLRKQFARDPVAYMFIGSELPEPFIEDHATGKLVWVEKLTPDELGKGIAHALNSTGEKAEQFSVKHLAQGEVLMREGEESGFFYFVISGVLSAVTVENQEIVELGSIRTGEFVGEMGVINEERRNATVRAIEPCQLLVIPAADFNRVILGQTQLGEGFDGDADEAAQVDESALEEG